MKMNMEQRGNEEGRKVVLRKRKKGRSYDVGKVENVWNGGEEKTLVIT